MVKFIKFSLPVYIFICPNCGSKYDGDYCSCQENDLGD